jgi:DUF4097 and DUF4098 domain-containing protein YvlB
MSEAFQSSGTSRSFATPKPVDLEVRNPSGTIEVVAADTDTSTVEIRPLDDHGEAREFAERTKVELSGDGRQLTVVVPERRLMFGRGTRIAVAVRVPTDSRVRLRAASADTTCRGRLAELEAQTASGEISAEEVTGRTDVRAASGAIRVGAAGPVQAHTASGAVRVGSASGDVEVHVASGRVEIGSAAASVSVKSASGDLSVDEVSSGRIELTTASGDLRIGVRAGVVARLDLYTISGRARSELPVEDTAPAGGSTVEIRAKTVSGNVLISRAADSHV